MWVALVVIGAISAVVIAGTIYLTLTKAEELPLNTKVKILLVVGVVVFISFVVTTLKHRTLGWADPSPTSLDIKKVFFADGCRFPLSRKHSLLDRLTLEHVAELYRRNYQGVEEGQ